MVIKVPFREQKLKFCKIFLLKNGLKIERSDSGHRRTLHAHGDRNTWRKESTGGDGGRLFPCLAKGGVSWGSERLLEFGRLFEEIRWFVVGGFASVFSPGTNDHFQEHGLPPFYGYSGAWVDIMLNCIFGLSWVRI